MNTTVSASAAGSAPAAREKFLVIPIIILILAQMGTTGDNGALSLATSALTTELHATTAEIQLANMIYPLVGGAFMIAGGLVGTIIGWKKTFRAGTLLCAAGELALAFAPNMAMFIWVGRVLVGFGASFLIPSVLGLIPLMYRGANRAVAFGCIGAASGLSAVLPLMLGVVMETGGMRMTFSLLAAYFLLVFALSLELPRIEQDKEHLTFDGVGVALAATGLFLFLIGLLRRLVQNFAAARLAVLLCHGGQLCHDNLFNFGRAGKHAFQLCNGAFQLFYFLRALKNVLAVQMAQLDFSHIFGLHLVDAKADHQVGHHLGLFGRLAHNAHRFVNIQQNGRQALQKMQALFLAGQLEIGAAAHAFGAERGPLGENFAHTHHARHARNQHVEVARKAVFQRR